MFCTVFVFLIGQVEFLTGQVSQLEDEAGAKRQYEAALDSSEKGRSAAEASLRGAVEENRAIRQELLSLQGEVGVMRDSRGSEELRLAGELAGANAAVATLKQELADLKADRWGERDRV
jgi:predicted  nucleic acid-binding Zn-ribbon protein